MQSKKNKMEQSQYVKLCIWYDVDCDSGDGDNHN
jgi:hypothetical protein